MTAMDRAVRIGFLLFQAVVIALMAPGCNFGSQAIQSFVSSCRTDDEIPAKDRAAVDQVAVEFVKNALGP